MFFCVAIHIPYKNQMKIYFNLNIALEVKVGDDDKNLGGNQIKTRKNSLLLFRAFNHSVIYYVEYLKYSPFLQSNRTVNF